MNITQPIDAIITWVDGYDPIHQQKLTNYLLQSNTNAAAIDPTRFNQCDEIRYCIMSILHFAPWIRTIYIITDAQTPSIVTQLPPDKVKIIDHQEIFRDFESYLPTFNSISIETMMWRIPQLAERFIYFNDDCMLIKPLTPENFFHQDKIVLRGQWKTQTQAKWQHQWRMLVDRVCKRPLRPVKQDDFRAWQENCAQLVGLSRQFFHLPHEPAALFKSTFEQFFNANPELLIANITHRLRHLSQLFPISLARHLDILHQRVTFDNVLQAMMVNPACHSMRKIMRRLQYAKQHANIPFVCIQSLDRADQLTRTKILAWLEEVILEDR